MKKVILFFVLFIPLMLLGQEISFENSSLKKIIKKADSLSIRGKYAQSIKLLRNISLELSNKEQVCINFKIASTYQKRKSLDSSAYYIDKANNILKGKTVSDEILYQKHSILGNYFYGKELYDTAMYNHLEALKIAIKLKKVDLEYLVYLDISQCFIVQKNFKKAEDYINKAEKNFNKTDNIYEKIKFIETKSFLMRDKGDLKSLEKLAIKLLELSQSKNYTKGKLIAYGNLSRVNITNYPIAYDYTKKMFNEAKKIEYAGNLKNTIENTGKLIALNESTQNKDSIAKGVKLFNESRELSSSKGHDILMGLYTENTQKNHSNDKEFLDSAKILTQSIDKDYEIEQLVKTLINRDSIYQTQLKSKTDELETKYRTKEKELTIEKEKKRKQEYAGIAILTLASLLFFIYYAYTRKKRIEHKNKLKLIQIEHENKLTLIQIEHENKLALVTTKQKAHNDIGKELHDIKAKDLERIAIQLENKGETTIALEVTQIKDSIRHLSSELQSISFEESSFIDQLITLGAVYSNDTRKIKFQGIKDVDWLLISDTIKRNLFLVIREGISNAILHGKASIVTVVCKNISKHIEVSIIDNGAGFDPKQPISGSGIRNMKMRIQELDGTIQFKSIPQKGTSIYITIIAA